MICDSLHMQPERPAPRHAHADAARAVAEVLKLDDARLMAVHRTSAEQVKRERQLRQSDAWLNAVLTSISDYALVARSERQHRSDWNQSIARVTGYSERAVIGRPIPLFLFAWRDHAATAGADRLREADANGWSLDEWPGACASTAAGSGPAP
jgi:PAS domain-containing protein